jgi:hypothetical protein
MPSDHKATQTYRLIVIRRCAGEIFALKNKECVLPRVEVLRQRRTAEQLTAETKRIWGLETCCLIILDSDPSQVACAVMECVTGDESVADGTQWMPSDATGEWPEFSEAVLIRYALAELASVASGEKPGPFARAGWLQELFRWADAQTAPLGLRLTGEFQQFSASPTSNLVRLTTENGALWFKAAGELNAHELGVTVRIAHRFPQHVPVILGIHTAWNGWLSIEAPGTPLDELTHCAAWEKAAETLGELQLESIGKCAELVEAGCKDMGLVRVQEAIAPFLARMDEFMHAQERNSPAPLSSSELGSLGDALSEAFSQLRSFGFPDTLGQLDCNPGNIVVSPDHCTFLDWAEACVTNPVITFEYLRRHLRRSGVEEPVAEARIVAAYLRPWTSLFSPEEFLRAMTVASPVAVFVHAVARDTWRTLNPTSNASVAGYYRSLTRKMFRDTIFATVAGERRMS